VAASSALYDAARFEPLAGETWSAGAAGRGIGAIVERTEAALDPDGLWPAHEWDAWTLTPPLSSMYVGAAGIVLGLDLLRRRGVADTRLDLGAIARRALERWRAAPELPLEVELPPTPHASLLSGEAGILLITWRLSGEPSLAEELLARVRENVDNPTDEVMWGAPGTMVAARAMHAWTGEARWGAAWQESARGLLDRRDADGLWTQDLYGRRSRELGPVHGMTGNVAALLDGGDLLDLADRAALERDARAVLARTAIVEDGLPNWPSNADRGTLPGRDGEIRLQWCAGAPGIVTAAAPYLDEDLLLAGAELTWRAGAHGPEKGVGLCHGTAGNGYALLRTFERTGDERWLDRARAFAMHALAQADGRHALFTGDLGAALLASDCLAARARYPVLGDLD
jgi:lantibiotic modifying enzyme